MTHCQSSSWHYPTWKIDQILRMYRYVCMTCVYVCHNITNLCFCVYQYLKTYLPLFFRGYADLVEKKLKVHGLVVECAHLPESMTLLAELEDASRRGVLYGITISSQHEVHHSVTVHILDGTQQGKLPPLYCAQRSTPCVIFTNTCTTLLVLLGNSLSTTLYETTFVLKLHWCLLSKLKHLKQPPCYCTQRNDLGVVLATTLLVLLGNNLSTVLYEAKCVLKLHWFLSSKLKRLNRLRSSSNCNVFFWEWKMAVQPLHTNTDRCWPWLFMFFFFFFWVFFFLRHFAKL